MKSADYWIKYLELQPHPEGGFFKENYRSKEMISKSGLAEKFSGDRNVSTSIYFLLRSGDISVFHRIKSDELWHFYQGETLIIYVLTECGLKIYRLGTQPELGDKFQIVIPANHWFAASVEKPDGYSLVGCTVAPGFDFSDFEMANRQQLLIEFPSHEQVITQLCKS